MMCESYALCDSCVCLRLGSLPVVINGLSGICMKNLHWKYYNLEQYCIAGKNGGGMHCSSINHVKITVYCN